ncbi:hypothetical protein WR25_21311 [Diploscapter pachys]|uniref:MADF domain-containing protein n=1 Tax=Diploscapter pachys TaxID=2018661 RepID=A0A2A2KMN3_9BILA|nr:hypothetical protein WR25_21311 [Diploscapter pachys]
MSRKRFRTSEEELPKQEEYDSDSNEPEFPVAELMGFDPETSQPDPLEATNRKRSARRSTAEIAQQIAMRTVPLTEEARHRMLELMQDDECRVIWDSSLLLHSSKNATNYAYQQIVDTLKAEGHKVLSCSQLRYNFNGLHAVYRKQLEKLKSGDFLYYHVTWSFFDKFATLFHPANLASRDFRQILPSQANSVKSVKLVVRSQESPKRMKKESEESSKQAQVGRKQERVEVSSTARNLANTFTALCEQLESKKPGSSKTVCLEMIKVIEKATLAFYDL